MNTIDEIRELFADGDPVHSYRLATVSSKFPAWVVIFYDRYGVAVPYSGKKINETFNSVDLYSETMTLGDEQNEYLFLTSSAREYRNIFADFCEDFVEIGFDGEKRKALIKDPAEWWENWSGLVGNSLSQKQPHSILGELMIYYRALETDKNVIWGGPDASSHDVMSSNAEYEVKSTFKKTDNKVHIASIYQMKPSNRPLYLCLCRFEPNITGISIDYMVDRLAADFGILRDNLDEKLKQKGYGPGSSARKVCYQPLSITKYPVDEKFPAITVSSFVGGALPADISNVEYDVDLTHLQGSGVSVEI